MTSPSIFLGDRLVGRSDAPYIIAEIGVNHEGSLDQALRLIDLAKEGGADAAKFQSYKASALASRHSPAYWDTAKEPTKSQFELFKKYDSFGIKEYEKLAKHCQDVGIDFVSTPFDDNAVDFLDPIVPFYKIASADLTNTPLLRGVGKRAKPVVLSTGACTLSEVDVAVNTLTSSGCTSVALLHCILNYPTDNENAHLMMIQGLQRAYPDLVIGYSDHTVPDKDMLPLLTAYLKGAVILEKHFTHDKGLPGNDHYHAMDVNDLKNFVSLIARVRELLGKSDHKVPIPSEHVAIENARRSIVTTRDLKAGHVLRPEDLTYKRPGTGISTLHWDDVVGCRLRDDLESDHVLQWRDTESSH